MTADLPPAVVPFRDMADLDRFLSAFDLTPLLVAVSDVEHGRTVRLNRNYYAVSGYTPDEALGKSFVETGWFSSGNRECVAEGLRKDGVARNLEFLCTGAGGRRVWVLCSSQYVHVGERLLVLSIGLDITARKEAETTAEVGRGLLQQMSGKLPGVLYQSAVEEDGTIRAVYVSPESVTLLGLEARPEDYFGRFMAGVHEEDRERLETEITEAVAAEGPFRSRFRFLRPDGRLLWIESHAIPVRDGGRILFNGIQVDVTERVEMEEALAESRRRLEELTAALPGVISQARVNRNGTVEIVYLAGAARDFYGIDTSLDGFLERFLAHIHEEDRRRCAESVMRAAERVEPWEFLGRFVRPDGRTFWLEAKAIPMRRGEELYFNGVFLDVTERIRTENALREAEERYRLLIETTDTGYVIVDALGRVLDANREYVRQAGRDRLEEILGRPVTEWTAPEDAARNAEEVEKCVRTGSVRNLVVDYLSPGGDRRSIEINASVMRADGEARILSLCRDITERRRIEEALRESEERFALFLDNLPAGAFLKDGEGRTVHVNRYMRETFTGWNAVIGKRNEELFPGAVGEGMAREDRRVVSEGITILKEVRLPDSHGVERIYQTLKFPVPASSRRVYVGGIAVDVTERVRAVAELRASEERFALFLDQFPAVAFMKDEDGVVIHANRYVTEQVWGRKGVGERMMATFPPPIEEKLASDDRRALAGETVIGPEPIVDFRGAVRTFQTYKFPVRLSGGGIAVGCIGIEITDRIRAEEALRESEERLRRLAAHQREVVEEERSRIAREIHDELAQQLTVQRMDLFWLRKRLSTGDHSEEEAKVNEMMEGVERTRKVVDQVIRDLRPPLLDDLGMTPALEWLTGQFRARTGIVVSLSVVPKGFPVSGPVGAAVYRIVQEALTNVARHAEASQARVSLRRRGGNLFLSVSDDGRGMEGEGKAGAATGHGLLGIRERVRAMEGSVEIRSRRGGGTSLAVRIPLKCAGGEA